MHTFFLFGIGAQRKLAAFTGAYTRPSQRIVLRGQDPPKQQRTFDETSGKSIAIVY